MAENSGERQWIVEPPAPGEVTLHMAFGEGVQLTKEQEDAVGALLRSLEAVDSEVTGFRAKCPKQAVCTNLTCDPVSCSSLKCGTLSGLTQGVGSWNIMGSFGGIA